MKHLIKIINLGAKNCPVGRNGLNCGFFCTLGTNGLKSARPPAGVQIRPQRLSNFHRALFWQHWQHWRQFILTGNTGAAAESEEKVGRGGGARSRRGSEPEPPSLSLSPEPVPPRSPLLPEKSLRSLTGGGGGEGGG